MTVYLAILLEMSVIVFAVTSMLSVGFGHTVRQILGPLRDARKVARAFVANFVLVPLLAYIVIQVIPLEPPRAIGLFLTAAAAGAPFLLKLVEAAESDVSLSASLLVLLIPLSIIYMPIVVPLVLPAIVVGPVAIATPLVTTMLLPLAAGLYVRAKAEHHALRLQPWFQQISTGALIVLIVATVLNNVEAILGLFDLRTILAVLIINVGAFGIGFLLGGPDWASREVLGLGTGQRNIAAATVVATQAVAFAETLATIVFASLVALALLFALAALLRGRGSAEDRTRPGADEGGRRRAA